MQISNWTNGRSKTRLPAVGVNLHEHPTSHTNYMFRMHDKQLYLMTFATKHHEFINSNEVVVVDIGWAADWTRRLLTGC